MSYAAQAWAADQRPATSTDKLVLMALAYHAGKDDGGVCWPGQETIADFAICSVDSVQRSLKRLAADGFITIEKGSDAQGRRKYDRYRLLFDVVTTAPNGTQKRHRAVHTANCGVDGADQPRHAKTEGLAPEDQTAETHTADCGMDAEIHTASHAANHTANHAAICGANYIEPIEHSELSPLPPAAAGGKPGEGEGETSGDDWKGAEARGIEARGWAAGWDQAARSAVFDLVGSARAHVASAFLIPLVGTLRPPAGVHAASYVRDLAVKLAPYPEGVLIETARLVGSEQVRDLPAATKVRKIALEVAKSAVRAGAAGGTDRKARATALDREAWLLELWRGDPADPTVALKRRLVGRMGEAAAHAWFADAVAVLDGDGVRVVQASAFLATYATTRLAEDVLIAVKAEWPDLRAVKFETAEGRVS